MIESDLVDINLGKAREVVALLERLDYGRDDVGRLSADLSDLYCGAERFKRLLDLLLATPPVDRDRFGEALSDLYEAMRHLDFHLESSLDDVDALAERFD